MRVSCFCIVNVLIGKVHIRDFQLNLQINGILQLQEQRTRCILYIVKKKAKRYTLFQNHLVLC